MNSLLILMIYALLGVIFGCATFSEVSKEDRKSWVAISAAIWPIMLGYYLAWEI